MSENNNKFDYSSYVKHVKNNGKHKSRTIAGILIFFFGFLGIDRLYMGKSDFFLRIILVTIASPIYFFYSILRMIIYISMSDRRFNIICQINDLGLEWKLTFCPESELDIAERELGIIVPEAKYNQDSDSLDKVEEFLERNSNVDTVRNLYVSKTAINDDNHEHIKEDKVLASKINKSQDRLDRYKSNDYFPTTNKTLNMKEKTNRIKELKEELKAGLMSKEDYDEEMKKL